MQPTHIIYNQEWLEGFIEKQNNHNYGPQVKNL